MTELEAISPEDARDGYIEDRDDELATATLGAHKYRLAPVIEWCELEGVEELRALGGRDFARYKTWRKNEKGNPNNDTLNTQLSTLRVFIKWAGRRELVPRDLHEFIDPPRMARKPCGPSRSMPTRRLQSSLTFGSSSTPAAITS